MLLIIGGIVVILAMALGSWLSDQKWKENAKTYIRTSCGGRIYKVIYADGKTQTPLWNITTGFDGLCSESPESDWKILVAQQAMKIQELESKLVSSESDREEIRLKLICIGGPLNDNILGFNGKQLAFLKQIHDLVQPQD